MNIKEKLIFCFAAIIISNHGNSQNKIIPSIEIGISISQFPSKNATVTWQISDSTETKTNPLIGPVIGFSTMFHLSKNIYSMLGLNYQISGTKTYSYSHWIDPNIYPSSYFKNWQNLKIHKICVPITLGYEFNLKKMSPIVLLGINPNLVLSAKLYEKSFHSQWTEPIETTTNLLSKKVDYQPPKRIIYQLIFGFMIPIGQNTKVSLSYSLGHNYYINTYWVRGNYSRVPYDVKTSIKSSDYILSIQYDLIKHEKKKSSP